MSWETRGNNRYYYRRRKVGGRIVSEYVGGGYLAELTAAQDLANRQRRQRAEAEWRAMVEDDRRHDETLAEVEDLVRTLTAGVLLASGYHTHRRQWRKVKT